LTIAELTPPQRPLSEVIGTSTVYGFGGQIGALLCKYKSALKILSIACKPKSLPSANLLRSPFILEAETIFIALVILPMDPTDFILILSAFSLTAKSLLATHYIIAG